MHPHFYSWHQRVQIKPESAVLETRWKAAAKYSEKLTEVDVLALVKLILFPGADPEYGKRLTEAFVKAEVTFPVNDNDELLRVMAAAVVHSCLEKSSFVSDALALGARALAFPEGRAKPVCQEIMDKITSYLAEESENIRPNIDAGLLERTEKKVQEQLTALKTIVDANGAVGPATIEMGRGLLAALKESHSALGDVIGRIREESQFVWWLVGGMSEIYGKRRKDLSSVEYALPMAHEAAKRVEVMPPASSVESVLEEVLSQCGTGSKAAGTLVDLVSSADQAWADKLMADTAINGELPISSLLQDRKGGGKPKAETLKKYGVTAKTKLLPIEAARQYFRELMFAASIEAMR